MPKIQQSDSFYNKDKSINYHFFLGLRLGGSFFFCKGFF
jgi:hypothetical protein